MRTSFVKLLPVPSSCWQWAKYSPLFWGLNECGLDKLLQINIFSLSSFLWCCYMCLCNLMLRVLFSGEHYYGLIFLSCLEIIIFFTLSFLSSNISALTTLSFFSSIFSFLVFFLSASLTWKYLLFNCEIHHRSQKRDIVTLECLFKNGHCSALELKLQTIHAVTCMPNMKLLALKLNNLC